MTYKEYVAQVDAIMMKKAGVKSEDIDDGCLCAWFIEMWPPNEAAITLLAKDGMDEENY